MKEAVQIYGESVHHQYLCVPDGKGDYTCGGQDQRGESKGDGLWGPGKASNDTKKLLAVVTSLKPIIVVWRTV